MKKVILSVVLIFALTGSFLKAQTADFTGYKVFINPGHGGHDDNDRHMLTTDFWESDGNLEKGLYLRQILENMHATVYMSRVTNYTEDDLALSAISDMANAANVDIFISIHSNGYDGKQNQPLMLFRGYDDQPVFPAAKTMAQILWQKIFEKGNCWTNSNAWVKGDWTFYPEWGDKVGLGVLRGLAMPGVLSEGSFHDYISESWRLRNSDFLHHESWALERALTQYANVAPVNYGVIAGVVRDTLKSPSWYFKPGTRDEKMPLNGVDVTLVPGGKTYHTDNLNNGFFMFDSLSAGSYKLYFDGLDDYFRDSLSVTVTANASTLADCYLQYDTTLVPQLTGMTPSLTDSLLVNQTFTFTFDLPMNRDSVQKAIRFVPDVATTYTWDESSMEVILKPVTGFTDKTAYALNISRSACSKYKVPIASAIHYAFATKRRSAISIERTFPENALTGTTIYPQVRIYFDLPVDQTSATNQILLKDDQGQVISKVREKFVTSEGKGAYFFEPSQALQLNKQYQISIGADLTDVVGTKLKQSMTITFTTRTKAYETGSAVENYDLISHFWDPEASGSTVGTDNPLTTFTSSSDVKRSGNFSGRLDYVFVNSSGGVCRVFDSSKPSIGGDATKVFGIWVFGDLSHNQLEYWFYSSGSTNQIVVVDDIDWAGWDLKTIPLSSVGGSGEKLFHSTVIRQSNNGSKTGSIWFDDALLITPTGIEDIKSGEIGLKLRPNPLLTEGTISFDLDEEGSVSMIIFSSDGHKVYEQAFGYMYPGPEELHWVPARDIPDGIYYIRLEIKPLNGGLTKTVTRKWVLAR